MGSCELDAQIIGSEATLSVQPSPPAPIAIRYGAANFARGVQEHLALENAILRHRSKSAFSHVRTHCGAWQPV
jgi:hypothetical protein